MQVAQSARSPSVPAFSTNSTHSSKDLPAKMLHSSSFSQTMSASLEQPNANIPNVKPNTSFFVMLANLPLNGSWPKRNLAKLVRARVCVMGL
jgi:hypothetical protein